MKKSKIIVPALGIIALSTAASITGTVAWFTASKSATITAGNFAVTKTTNNLEVVLSAGIGTTAPSNSAISTVENNLLTDASFDHRNTGRAIYTPDGAGTSVAAVTTLADAIANPDTLSTILRSQEGNKKVYSIMTFEMAVTVEFGATSGDIGLFLKTKKDNEQDTAYSYMNRVGGEGDLATAKGFRMAFVPKNLTTDANAVARVWADLQEDTVTTVQQVEEHTVKYVDHVSTADGTQQHPTAAIKGVPYDVYADDTEGYQPYTPVAQEAADDYPTTYLYKDLIDTRFAATIPADGKMTAANAAKRVDYLGKFAFTTPNTRVTLNYTVVCWFEGTDPEIVNRTSTQTRSSTDMYETVTSQIVLTTSKFSA